MNNGLSNGAADVVLGRLADPRATTTDELPGGCRCPGTPHGVDTVTYRTELGSGERNSIRVAGWAATDYAYYDFEAANDAAIAKTVVDWTLIGPTKERVEISRQTASLLDETTRVFILERINAAFEAFIQVSLPNGSGAPSAALSSASASPNRETRRRHSSTTA